MDNAGVECPFRSQARQNKRNTSLQIVDEAAGWWCALASQLRTVYIPYLEARGPTRGRAMQSTLMRDEDFCIQIDAHVDYVVHFDEKMIVRCGVPHPTGC